MLKPIGILEAGKGLAHGGFWYTLKYMSFKNKFSVYPQDLSNLQFNLAAAT